MGKAIVDQLKKKFDIQETWLGYELHPGTPAKGIPLSERYPDRDMSETFKLLRERGAEAGITIGDITLLSNSRLALEAAEYAKDAGKHGAFHENMFRAYFTEALDIGKLEVVCDVAAKSGLDVDAMKLALMEKRYRSRLQQVREAGRKIDLSSLPTFVINWEYKIVGAQSIEVFQKFFEKIR